MTKKSTNGGALSLMKSKRVLLAHKIANKAHSGQVDDNGYPFIAHLVYISNKLKTEDTCVAALMHDILSTSITIDDIKSVFTEQQVKAIELLQDTPLISDFPDRINRIKENDIAKAVEIEYISYMLYTLKDSKNYPLIMKYRFALQILKE